MYLVSDGNQIETGQSAETRCILNTVVTRDLNENLGSAEQNISVSFFLHDCFKGNTIKF